MTHNPRRHSSSEIEAAASDWVIRRERGLNEPEKEEFTRWIASNPLHADAIARHDQAWAILDRPRSAGTASKMALTLSHRATRRRKRARITAVAASMFLIPLFVWLLRPPIQKPSAPPTARVTMPQKQILPDGSQIDLKNGAEVSIDFTESIRRVRLVKGEAYFQVAKNRERPFVVSADHLEVKAVGTEFAVGLGSDSVDVIVTEGRVAVADSPSSASPPIEGESRSNPTKTTRLSTSLDAGKRLIVDRSPTSQATKSFEMTAAEMSDRLAWRCPRIEFSRTPLSEAVSMMNQYSKIQMIIDDPQCGDTLVSGIFRAGNTDALITVLEGNFEIKTERVGRNIILRREH